MVRTTDVATFEASKFEETVKVMLARRESVRDAGENVYRRTGNLDPNVDIVDRITGKGKVRVSHNSFVKAGDKVILPNGIALPIATFFDGTGSMGGNVSLAFEAIPVMDSMLTGIRHRYNTQVASGVWQDVVDPHPVVQMSQFESDNRIAEQLRLLLPDNGGGDEIEDYDLGLAFLRIATQTDIVDFYGLKGYAFVVADQIGRGVVYPDDVQRHLGHNLQLAMSTRGTCSALLQKWHLYYVQVGSGGGARRNNVTEWWEEKLGRGRVVIVPDPALLAEVQAGLIYVTETAQPNGEDLEQFLSAGGQNRRVSSREVREIWEWLQDAAGYFGQQAYLSGYNDIPMPGNTFEHFRDPWPIGHRRFSENPSQGGSPATPPIPPSAKSEPIDWKKF